MGCDSPGVGFYNDVKKGTFEHKRLTINSNYGMAH